MSAYVEQMHVLLTLVPVVRMHVLLTVVPVVRMHVPEKVAYLCNNMISAGSVRIDDTGVFRLDSLNSAA